MIIKEISTQHPHPDNYFFRDLKKEYNEDKTKKIFYNTYKNYQKSMLNYYNTNKKYNLLDFEIIEED